MTVTDFVPSTVAPFQFSPTLDGATYNVIVTWSLFGRRFYINVYALDGTLVLSTALVGSPTGFVLQTITWDRGRATATAVSPHGLKVGKTVDLTITGAAPDAYNGQVQAFITGPATFSWPLAQDPGAATATGSAAYGINLVGGLFASTLIYREASNRFEVSP